jgi:hypothetical protein
MLGEKQLLGIDEKVVMIVNGAVVIGEGKIQHSSTVKFLELYILSGVLSSPGF